MGPGFESQRDHREASQKCEAFFVFTYHISIPSYVFDGRQGHEPVTICFIILADESGTSNLVVFQKLFTQYRREIVQSHLLMVEGKVQKEGEVIHVVVKRCYNLSELLWPLSEPEGELAKESKHEKNLAKSNDGFSFQYDVFHEGRNFK